jgi:ubiquinone/menaquinone biosynthesis C-methylase UbiE
MEPNNYDGIADLYDIYVPAEHDIPFFLDEAQQISGPILELMAGTGRVSLPLIEAGNNLTCEDSSVEMLNILGEKLKSKGLSTSLIPVDVCHLDLPEKFSAVFIPFNSFSHLTSIDQQKEALRRIARHLTPGGTFICTLANPCIRKAQIDGHLHLFRNYSLPNTGGMLLLWLLEKYSNADPHVVETAEFFEEYDRSGILTRKRLMELNFRLSDRNEFENLAWSAGFKVTSFFGDYDRSKFDEEISPHMIWKMKLRSRPTG